MFENRRIFVETPLGEDLRFAVLDGYDEIGCPFRYRLELASENYDVSANEILGKPFTIRIGSEDEERFFHGFAAEFRLLRFDSGFAMYEVVLRPWLWFLTNSTDNRIFQQMSAVEIIEEVFSAYPEARFDKRLDASYDPREYCVQYGESDLDFVQRLMEDEGIAYFFEHAASGHTLVMTDANSRFQDAGGDLTTIPFLADPSGSSRERDYILDWQPCTSVVTGAFVRQDYDFEKPSADLATMADNPQGHDQDAAERYHYPGRYTETSAGDKKTRIRLEEVQAPARRVQAISTAPGLWSGHRFALSDFPRESENDDYVIVRTEYRATDDQYRSGAGRNAGATASGPMGGDMQMVQQSVLASRIDLDEELRGRILDHAGEAFAQAQSFLMGVVAQPRSLPYRPPRRTPRPVMKGPQTATVVGPAGAEIFTDEYSRVKVQFHWDRLGADDENSSCFVRVSSVWAGSGWGFIQIPRIGQEVIVDFLEGDPDQPLITGRVYNAEQMPPYGLPGNETQSGWKSMSSPGGGGWNELRFEDKKGEEEVYFQAEKNHTELVKNDETRTIGHDWVEDVGNDATQSIGHDRTESVVNDKSTSVGNNRTVSIGVNDDETVGANRSLKVGADETISIGANSTETIGANHTQSVGAVQTISVGAARVDTVGAAEARTVGGAQTQTVALTRAVAVGAAQSHDIGASDTWTVGASRTSNIGASDSTTVGGDQSLTVGGARSGSISGADTLKVGADMTVNVGASFVLQAADQITLKCGGATMVLKSDGTIALDGKDISLKASGKISAKASSDVTIKGSKISQN